MFGSSNDDNTRHSNTMTLPKLNNALGKKSQFNKHPNDYDEEETSKGSENSSNKDATTSSMTNDFLLSNQTHEFKVSEQPSASIIVSKNKGKNASPINLISSEDLIKK